MCFVDDRGILYEVRAGQGTTNWSWEEASLTELSSREEYLDEAGWIVRTIEDDSGALYSLILDKKGVPSEVAMIRPPA